MVFSFSDLDLKSPFWVNLVKKIQNCQFKLKFGTKTNLNKQNSMMMFNFSVFDHKYLSWEYLVQKLKIMYSKWNLTQRLIRICRIQWWCLFYLLRLNQICLYKTLIKRWIFDDTDEIEIMLGCWSMLTSWNTSGGYLTPIFNTDLKRWLITISKKLCQNKLAPKRYSQKFLKTIWEKIALRHLLKSQKYWNC